MAQSAVRPLYLDLIRSAPGASVELEQVKLDRLRELRATIDALRTEQTAADPLLAWVMAQDSAGCR
jgi:hypothetical protein